MTTATRGVLAWMVAVLLTLGVTAPGAPAQAYAPAGNEHPREEGIAGEGEASEDNPFGPHVATRAALATTQQKWEFAQSVDLSALRGLAVFHHGRVKVLDTLARETVQGVTGQRRYSDFLPADASADGRAEQVKFDPLFTLLDTTIDPVWYLDRPLLGINYLPLRRELLENQFPRSVSEENLLVQERWMRAGRVTPLMAERWVPQIAQSHAGEQQYMEGLGRLDQALRAFAEGRGLFVMVAPQRRDLPWDHLSTLPPENPARQAALALGAAWRERNAAGVNASAQALAEALPAINAEVYPTTSRRLEMFYNRLNAFEWGWVLYATSLVALLLSFGTGRRWLAWTGGSLLAAGCLMHAVGFIARCIIAERFAIQNQFESMTGLSLFAVITALCIGLVRKQWIFGAAAAAVGFMVLVTATQTAIPGVKIEREAAILNTSVLLKYHVTIVLVSYGLIALGFVLALFYLGVHYFGKRDGAAPALVTEALETEALVGQDDGAGEASVSAAPVSKVLADLDTAQMIVLQLAFWTLGVGILLGAWWADHSWGRWWAFDPKETWALITWIVYLIVVHVRIARPVGKGLTTAWLSVIGFVIMLWTYFGVNLLLPGLHAYA